MAVDGDLCTIRRIRIEEAPRFRELRLRALSDAPSAFGETKDEALRRGPGEWETLVIEGANSDVSIIFVAEYSGNLVGCATGWNGKYYPREQLGAMWVAPEWRGRGVAERLVIAVIDWLNDLGADVVRLSVTLGNEAAARFYRRLGFMETGEREPLDSDPNLTVEYMERSFPDRPNAAP